MVVVVVVVVVAVVIVVAVGGSRAVFLIKLCRKLTAQKVQPSEANGHVGRD